MSYKNVHSTKKRKKKYNVLDLFAGAGGLSLGFVQQGGFYVKGVIENNEDALSTYKQNHKQALTYVEHDIRKVDFKSFIGDGFNEVDVIIGGPPCQGFSNANRQKCKFISMNNALVKIYADAVLEIKPSAFVMENVAMLKSEVHKFFDSKKDYDEVLLLGIKKKEEVSVVMNKNPDGIQMLAFLQDETKIQQYYMHESLFNRIKLIKRYLGQEGKLNSYFKKHSSIIIKGLIEYSKKINSDEVGDLIRSVVNNLLLGYRERTTMTTSFRKDLDLFIEFERAIGLMKELYDNEIIFELIEDEHRKIKVKLQSYTVFDYLAARLGKKYSIVCDVMNAVDFGVPQERRRFIMIGMRKDILGRELNMPISENKTKNTVKDAIYDLEKYKPRKSVDDLPIAREEYSENKFTRMLQDNVPIIYNHVNTATREIAQKRFAKIKPGKNFHSLDISMKEDTYSDPARTQNTIYLRLEYDKPCGTVVNVRKSMWIHPTKDRAISIRESARLQTFPDSYIFYGSKDSQYQQIGNAVPPMLAKAIAGKIYELLEEGREYGKN